MTAGLSCYAAHINPGGTDRVRLSRAPRHPQPSRQAPPRVTELP